MTREAMNRIVDDHFMYEATADLEGVLRTYTEDPVHQVVGGPDGPLRGKAAIRGFYERLFPALKGERAEPVMRLYGDDFIVDESVRLLHVFQLRDGLIANERVFFDFDEMRRQLSQEIRMQPVRLYNWNDLPKDTPRPGIDRVAFRGDNAMAVMNWIKPGMQPGPHSHPFEQLVFIIQGRTRLHVGDQVFDCGPGSMVRVPPDVVHYAEAVGDEVCLNLDVFAPARKDYLHLVEYQK